MNVSLTKHEAHTVLRLLFNEATNAQPMDRIGRYHLRRVGRMGLQFAHLLNAPGCVPLFKACCSPLTAQLKAKQTRTKARLSK